MAAPYVDWDIWSQDSIEPFMEAVIHFTSGNVTITDDSIQQISFVGNLFDTSYILFGPPEPIEGSIDIIDFEQAYNPTLNSELQPNIQIDVYLGLYAPNHISDFLSWDEASNYSWAQANVYTWAAFQNIRDNEYLWHFNWQAAQESYTWGEASAYTWASFSSRVASHYTKQKYGVFYATEWSYDSVNHIATVNIIDAMNDALMLDNKADASLPAQNVSLYTFTRAFLSLYSIPFIYHTAVSPTLLYSCYYASQGATISNLLVALGACYCFLPDGSSAVCDSSGIYDTLITITDEDVEEYNILQTSATAYDAIEIEVQSPRLESEKILDYEDFASSTSTVLPFHTDNIYRVSYVVPEQTNRFTYSKFTWTPYGFTWAETSNYVTFKVYADIIKSTPQRVYNIIGTSPYSLTGNIYIQTLSHAQALLTLLEQFSALLYNTIEITIRGSYGLWLGAKVHLYSYRYNIDAEYIIIGISFEYSGAVHTHLTLQRVL